MTQTERIRSVMTSQPDRWLTLDEIADITLDPPASVSAQLRHLRKAKHGAHVVEKRRRTDTDAEWEYRVQ